MNETIDTAEPNIGHKSVQNHIDEVPAWGDGTPVAWASLTSMQWAIWGLATAGKFFEGMIIFATGVALPLIVVEFALSPTQKGVVSAAALFGILVGASALGGLADRVGRKRIFIVEMALFVAFLVLVSISPSYLWLVVCLFGLGVALGGDYPTAHMVISESTPSRSRGKLVVSSFGFQAVGALAGSLVGYLILSTNPDVSSWRLMFASVILPGVMVFIGRFFIVESGQWLASMGRIEEAERETLRLLARRPAYPQQVKLAPPQASEGEANERKGHWGELFARKNRRATILASLPWFIQDLGTYGIGIFTPTILALTLGAKSQEQNLAAVIHNDMLAAEGAAFLDLLLIVGIIFAVLLTDKIGRIRLQIFGFIGCALGLLLATLSLNFEGSTQMLLLFSGFMLFNFMNNLGPNTQTYLLAGEIFPTHIRGKGAGFAASAAKVGAVTTAFMFPILLINIGTQWLLAILIGTSLLGALATWIFRIEPKGKSLEELGAG